MYGIMNRYFISCFLICFGAACQKHKEFKSEMIKAEIHKTAIIPGSSREGEIANINTTRSGILWKGTKMLRTRSHEGTLGLKKGYLIFKNDSLTGGTIIADMDAVGITDIPAHESEAIRNLTNHLKSDFNTKKYPFSIFVITDVQYFNADSLNVVGNMTIKDITRSISVIAKRSENGHKQYSASFSLNRFAWNIGEDGSWLAKRLVDDEFELKVQMVLEE